MFDAGFLHYILSSTTALLTNICERKKQFVYMTNELNITQTRDF